MNLRQQVKAWIENLIGLTGSRLVRRIGIGTGAALILFSAAGFIGVPLIVRNVAEARSPVYTGRLVRAVSIPGTT